jgi:hypothetical protein
VHVRRIALAVISITALLAIGILSNGETPISAQVKSAGSVGPISTPSLKHEFQKGDTVYARTIVLYTGVGFNSPTASCMIESAPSAGVAYGPDTMISSSKSFVPAGLAPCDQSLAFQMPRDMGSMINIYGIYGFAAGDAVGGGIVTLADGTTYPLPCYFAAAPMSGTVHAGRSFPNPDTSLPACQY